MIEKIGIIGLGRLGLCFALNLERSGFIVHGYDISEDRCILIKNRSLKTKEPDVENLLKLQKNLFIENSPKDVFDKCDLIFVVIATPSKENGEYNHDYIDNFIEDNIINYENNANKHLVINSTVMPGYIDSLNKKLNNKKWYVSYNPEFIAQGSIIKDQLSPDIVLIGQFDKYSGDVLEFIYKKMCINNFKVKKMAPMEAEITKISLNCFLTTKISFANMIGDICVKNNLNPEIVLDAIGEDTRVGNKYIKYGFGYGGECLPRDNRALALFSKNSGVEPLISIATDEYNKLHLSNQVDFFIKNNSINSEYSFYKFAGFKSNSDIITESQRLKFISLLADNGYKIILIDEEDVIEKVKNIYQDKFIYKKIS